MFARILICVPAPFNRPPSAAHFTLCPQTNAQDCAGACYAPEYYSCQNGQLQQLANATQTANGAQQAQQPQQPQPAPAPQR